MAAWTQQHRSGVEGLTGRQREVLKHIADGRTNPEIAGLLGVSLAGAKWHVREVITKLGVENRDDAAEIWREANSLPRRFSNGLRAVLGFESLKFAGGALAVGAAVVGVISAAAAFRQSTSTSNERDPAPAAATLPEFPNAIYTRQQASDVARDLAMSEIAQNPALAAATFQGRRFVPSDLALADHRFVEDATWRDTGLPGKADDFPQGMDLWLVKFHAFGWDTKLGPDELVITVGFEDGKSDLVEAWIDTPAVPLPIADELIHPPRATEVVAEQTISGRTFRVLAGTGGPPWAWALGVQEPIRSELGLGSVEPGTADSPTEHIFGVAWSGLGASAVVFGAVAGQVATVELTTSWGTQITIEPQPALPSSEFPYRVFLIEYPSAEAIATIRALTAAGEVLAETDCSSAKRIAKNDEGQTWRCN